MNHDRLFKELLKTFFFQFIQMFLPALAARIEPGSLEFLDKEIFTDPTSSERHEVDLLAKCRFRDQGEAFFLIHVENQASSKSGFGKRMFRYFARLHEKHDLPVYPIVLFSFDKPLRPEPDRYRIDFPGFRVLDFAFKTIQLNRLNWRDFLRNPNPVASALMTKMKIKKSDRPKVKLECLRMLVTLKLDPAKATLISVFMDNYLKLTAAEMKVYNQEIESIDPKEREAVMEWTNEWIEAGKAQGLLEGVQKGRQEGRQEGRREAERQTVLRFLRIQVGAISSEVSEKVGRLTDDQLAEFSEALFKFRSPIDAQQWLTEHVNE